MVLPPILLHYQWGLRNDNNYGHNSVWLGTLAWREQTKAVQHGVTSLNNSSLWLVLKYFY